MAADSDDPASPPDPRPDGRPGSAAPAEAEADPSRADILEALQNVQARLARCEQEIARMSESDTAPHGRGDGDGRVLDRDFGQGGGRVGPGFDDGGRLPARAHARLAPADDGWEDNGWDEEPADGPRGPRRPPPRKRRRRSRTSRWIWPLLLILLLLAVLAGGAVWLVDDIREGVTSGIDRASRALTEFRPSENREGDAETAPPAERDAGPSPSPAAEDETAAAAGEAAPAEAGEPAGIVPAPRQTGGPAIDAAPSTAVEVVELEELDAALAPLPDDTPASIRTTAEMAMSGDPDAQHDLATLYALGEGIPRDYERAAFWFRLAADAGIANAQYNLGVLMHHGQGVPQDRAAAFTLFREAAESGHTEAQIAVGQAWRYGRGVERNPVRAASWFQAANAGGDPYGALYLGQMYEEGIDGAPDLSAAAGWYRLAAEGGIEEAEEALARLADESEELAPPEGTAEAEDTAAPEAAPAPAPEEEPAPVSPDGSVPDELGRQEIRTVQQLLAELGYEPGPVDGLMGERTAAAIRGFQEEEGLTVTGNISPALLARLRAAAGAEESGPEGEPAPDQTN